MQKVINHHSIGVCMIGNGQFNEDQYKSLEAYCRNIINTYPGIEIVGHYELDDKKTCPGFDVPEWVESIGL